MTANEVAKLMANISRGVITTSEAADHVMLTMGLSACAGDSYATYMLVPPELRAVIHSRLLEKCNDTQNWRPFILGTGLSDSQVLRINERLREVQQMISS